MDDDGNSVAMEDSFRLLEDYGVVDRTLLWVRPRSRQLAVERPHGAALSASGTASDTSIRQPEEAAQPQHAATAQGGGSVPALIAVLGLGARSVLDAASQVRPWKWGSA